MYLITNKLRHPNDYHKMTECIRVEKIIKMCALQKICSLSLLPLPREQLDVKAAECSLCEHLPVLSCISILFMLLNKHLNYPTGIIKGLYYLSFCKLEQLFVLSLVPFEEAC